MCHGHNLELGFLADGETIRHGTSEGLQVTQLIVVRKVQSIQSLVVLDVEEGEFGQCADIDMRQIASVEVEETDVLRIAINLHLTVLGGEGQDGTGQFAGLCVQFCLGHLFLYESVAFIHVDVVCLIATDGDGERRLRGTEGEDGVLILSQQVQGGQHRH